MTVRIGKVLNYGVETVFALKGNPMGYQPKSHQEAMRMGAKFIAGPNGTVANPHYVAPSSYRKRNTKTCDNCGGPGQWLDTKCEYCGTVVQ